MPKWSVRRMLLAAALAAAGGAAAAQTPTGPRPVALPQPPAPPRAAPTCVTADGMAWSCVQAPAERQVYVQCLVMEVPPAVWTKHTAGLPGTGPGPVISAVLDVAQAERLVRAMKADPAGAEILTRPEMLLTDNQTGFMQISGAAVDAVPPPGPQGAPVAQVQFVPPDGFSLRVTPKVSADEKQVQLRVEFGQTTQAPSCVKVRAGESAPALHSQTVQATVLVPGGKTIVSQLGESNKNLRVFAVTPHILRAGQMPGPMPVACPQPLTTKVFHVLDLVTPIPDFNPLAPAGDKPSGDKLLKLVTAYCRPNSWKANGGPGCAAFYEIGGALVVSQTPDVLREVEDLLAALRKLQDVCIASEVRIVTVPAGFCDARELFADAQPAAGGPVAFLTDARLRELLAATQADRRVNVLQAPKVTQFNGQTASIVVGQPGRITTGVEVKLTDGRVVAEPKTEAVCFPPCGTPGACGVSFTLQTTTSADKRSVRLAFAGTVTSANGPAELVPVTVPAEDGAAHTVHIEKPNLCRLAVERTVAVPDGGTVAFLAGTRPRPAAEPCKVLSRVPYVHRLFAPACAECDPGRDEVLVLVTPRVFGSAAEEQKQLRSAAHVEVAPAPRPACCAEPCAECRAADPRVAEAVAAYRKACADGRTEAAAALAVKALALDPTCFAEKK